MVLAGLVTWRQLRNPTVGVNLPFNCTNCIQTIPFALRIEGKDLFFILLQALLSFKSKTTALTVWLHSPFRKCEFGVCCLVLGVSLGYAWVNHKARLQKITVLLWFRWGKHSAIHRCGRILNYRERIWTHDYTLEFSGSVPPCAAFGAFLVAVASWFSHWWTLRFWALLVLLAELSLCSSSCSSLPVQ